MPIEKTSQSRIEKQTNSIHIIIVSNPESTQLTLVKLASSQNHYCSHCSGNAFVAGNTSHYLAIGMGREPFYHILLGLSDKENNNYRQRSKLRPFWSPWRVKKYLATTILTEVANWRPTDYKKNLLGKLIDAWSNYQK